MRKFGDKARTVALFDFQAIYSNGYLHEYS